VAQAWREQFGFRSLYLADLDAIEGGPPAVSVYRALRSLDFSLWVDAGVSEREDAGPLQFAGVDRIIVGLETIGGPKVLSSLCRELGSDRLAFSLDLKAGIPLGDLTFWDRPDPEGIAVQAIGCGIRHLIVLDLAQVGSGRGLGTEDLCTRLIAAYPSVSLTAGGGIRDLADIRRLESRGIKEVLVASALHDGRIRPQDLANEGADPS
jgi:phosphoribosylformimino-5-aminoimidazole carboxamide ribotide isomerase